MQFEYAYARSSGVKDQADSTAMSFEPDTKRTPTFFRGELQKAIPFREAMSALHDVVVSDLRWKPKDRTEYLEWRRQQDEIDWSEIAGQRSKVKAQLDRLQSELTELRAQSHKRMGPFYKARQRYFDYLYKKDYDAWFVLDPVITVHPDQVFFECFSQDESSYGRLSANYEVFGNIGEFACGTTNVDYSQSLYDEFQKIRSYKKTQFEVDPSGFEVQTTHEQTYKEVKIDLPDTWVRGFLQVSSAMSLDTVQVELHPMDLYNLCFVLRRKKEKFGPRGMRFVLEPGEPPRIILEPWNIEVVCPRTVYRGTESTEIRVWGRRRIHTLERLVPIAKKFTVHLLGTGMPSFYVADLGDMSFTLGLSGWTANDWSTAGNFDLMAPRADVDSVTQSRVFDALAENWFEDTDSLAKRLGLDRSLVLGALGAYTQAGRAIYDLDKQVYRVRELSREPLPMDKLRWSNEREHQAHEIVEGGHVRLGAARDVDGVLAIEGAVTHATRQTCQTSVQIDGDQRIKGAKCSCYFYQQNKMFKGPCEHILALRIAHRRNRFGPPISADAAPPRPETPVPRAPPPRNPTPPRSAEAIRERTIVQTLELGLERALRELVDRQLIEVPARHHTRVLEGLLEAALRGNDSASMIRRARSALIDHEFVEEVYASDEQLDSVLEEAFVFVQGTR